MCCSVNAFVYLCNQIFATKKSILSTEAWFSYPKAALSVRRNVKEKTFYGIMDKPQLRPKWCDYCSVLQMPSVGYWEAATLSWPTPELERLPIGEAPTSVLSLAVRNWTRITNRTVGLLVITEIVTRIAPIIRQLVGILFLCLQCRTTQVLRSNAPDAKSCRLFTPQTSTSLFLPRRSPRSLEIGSSLLFLVVVVVIIIMSAS